MLQDIEFYINDELIELSDDQKIYLSSKVNEIGVPENVKSAITETFKIYKTNSNLEVFDLLGIANANSQLPYQENTVRLINNGIPVFKKGLLGSIKNRNGYWSVIAKEGNANFFAQIDGANIRDLDLTEYEDLWTQAVQISTRTNTDGQIYPIIDYGLLDTHPNYIDNREMLPAVFEKTIWDAIFNPDKNNAISEKWRYVGEFISDLLFTDSVIPCITSYLSDDEISKLSSEAESSGQYILVSDLKSQPQPDQYDYLGVGSFKLNSIISDDRNRLFTYVDDYFSDQYVAYAYLVPSDGTYSVTGSIDINFQPTGDVERLGVNISVERRSGGSSYSQTVAIDGNITFEKSYDVDVSIDCIAGDSLHIRVVFEYDSTLNNDDQAFVVDYSTGKFTLASDADIVYGLNTFTLANNLPDMSQKDFIKQTMHRFGLISQTDINSNTVNFVKFEELSDRKKEGIVQDFSSKLDLNGIMNYDYANFDSEYELPGLSKRNRINYKPDDTVIEGFGDSYFDLESEKYTDDKKYIEFKYAATQSAFRLDNSRQIPIIAVFSKDEDDNVVLNDKIQPRILIMQRDDNEITYNDGTTSQVITTDIPYCRFDELRASNLIIKYYPTYINAVSKPEIVEAAYYLDIQDFADFDHFTLLYDKQFNAFFYVESITKFNPANSAKFKMLKIQ